MSQESNIGRSPDILGVPPENFSRGLLSVELPGFGPEIERKKIRGNWVVKEFDERIIATTDRQSAFDALICAVQGKGKVLTGQSAYCLSVHES